MSIRIYKLIIIFFSLIGSEIYASDKHLVVLGDSLTEGYNVQKEESYPALLDKVVNSNKKNLVKITNAGVSGSTSASGLSRLKWLLKTKPTHLILALGANDGLRGLKPEDTQKNLDDIIKMAKENKIKILIVGMQMPPNYGKEYTEKFSKIFSELAQKHSLELFPFLLADVAAEASLNLPDGIHPNPKGYQKIADNLMPYVQRLLND